MSKKDEVSYLQDMLAYSRRALDRIRGISSTEFEESDLRSESAVFLLTVIGEAASNISKQKQALHPEIAWPRIIGMRHRLVHNSDINRAVVWDTLTNDLPPLIHALEAILSEPAP
ncbi:MAG: hypothetical protein QOC81_5036 [Thermoanaerobaculia bacterium]|jgi:uncharacterized protein with HEPN domain|nr:hypothetical protein [Thermoanaerobaculia bacterium]